MRLKGFDLFFKIAACFFAMFWVGHVLAAQEELCDNEPALFQCQVRGGKNIALCPSYVGGGLVGVQYRFGRKEKKELVFPDGGYGFRAFASNHYIRYQVDYKRIKFSIGSYAYSIYSNYDGESAEGEARSAGVVISSSSGIPDIQMPCTNIYIDNLQELITHVKCDANDALGCK